uniref:Regulator of telomere elongation helicase 1 n=1 Tax=Mastacembelus armatus TaxID=205130 RepID=A0A7N9AMY3_9TELE
MPSLSLSGVTVDFPFPPYDCQKDYMSKVIECLQKKVNGVLESPTGTGKTLCLLCATLAWRDHFKDTISARKIAERLGGKEMFPNTPLSSWGTTATDGDKPTYYTDIPKIIYASRTHSQLAQVINELKNTSYRPKVCVLGSREQLCINQEVMRQESNHIKVHMCRGKVSTRSCVYYNNVEEKSTDRDLVNSILDVEDLVKFGSKQRVCPYYLSRSLKQQADIIFMPYNYLLDPKSRRAHNIELNGAVVIFDEAHNVEKTCEESTSFDLTPYDVASAITSVDRLLVEQAKAASHGESATCESNESFGCFDHTPCEKAKTMLTLVFAPSLSHCDCKGKATKLIIRLIISSPEHSNSVLVKSQSSFKQQVSLYPCCHCREFPVRLENKHVIERDQIFVSVIARGPDGQQLSSAFDRRFVPANMASLGNTVGKTNLTRVVPHGLLVFFPSFPLMEKTLEYWRANGHADRIENIKPMFVEPKGKGTFTEVIDGYYNKVNDPASKGGSFFAVCRGKASEGLDFADTFGRGVIITGLPFPPKMDPRVILKMQFLDEMSRKKAPGLKYLSGQEWYKQQAFRAVNQAIGRVIRHKDDYGAIFLCDQRFKNSDARAQLPSWVRPCVRLYDGFGNVVRDVSQFFRVAQKIVPESSGPDFQSSGSTFCSSSPRFHTQKAKVLDAHLPSLKRRRLSEYESEGGGGSSNGMAKICVEYEYEVPESQRRPVNLLDALERGDHREDADGLVGEEQVAHHLSTRSLQNDKRMDDELRGGKRKIKLVQEKEGKANRAKKFLAEMKKSLSQVNFDCMVQALQRYKKTDDLDVLLTETALLTEDANTHGLLRGFYQFVRPHHKKAFDEKCQELTGQGCGYKPDHSLSKDEKKALIGMSSSSQLNTQQLNRGGHHLSQHGLTQPQPGRTAQPFTADKEVHSTFLADVKKALGAEKSTQLFQAIHSYKKTDNYENLVTTVVSLFTERDEDFSLLVTFGMFIRPHHKKQYKEMLDALIGQSVSAADGPAVSEDLRGPARKSGYRRWMDGWIILYSIINQTQCWVKPVKVTSVIPDNIQESVCIRTNHVSDAHLRVI